MFGGFRELCIGIYNVSFNIKRGFYYLGGSFWNYVYIYMYLLILKEDFLFGGFRELCIYTYMYLSILKEAFIIWGVVFGDVFLFIPNLHNVLNKINIIVAVAGLWGINVSDEYFHVRGRVIFEDVLLFIPNLVQFSFVR